MGSQPSEQTLAMHVPLLDDPDMRSMHGRLTAPILHFALRICVTCHMGKFFRLVGVRRQGRRVGIVSRQRARAWTQPISAGLFRCITLSTLCGKVIKPL